MTAFPAIRNSLLNSFSNSFDLTVTNYACFKAMFSYTQISAISRNGSRCQVLDVVL